MSMSEELPYEEALERIQMLKSANSDLLKLMAGKDKEIASLKENYVSEEYTRLLNADTDMKEQRILELAKKNKTLTVALEKEKSRCARIIAEKALAEKRDQPPTSRSGYTSAAPSVTGGDDDLDLDSERELREAKAELAKRDSKLNDLRTQLDQFKAELKKAHRALVREVGEDVPLAKILEEGSGWKGRAQKISMLQSKLKEAQRSAPVLSMETSPRFGVSSNDHKDPLDLEEQQRFNLERMKSDRLQEIEHLTAEVDVKKDEIAGLRTKLERATARAANLEKDNHSLRVKIQVFLDKSANDDQLVDALKQEMEKQQKTILAVRKQLAYAQHQQQQQLNENDRPINYDQLRQINTEQEQQLDRQEQIIIALRKEIEQNNAREQAGDLSSSHSVAKAQAADVEADRLTELAQVLKTKLSASEQRCEDLATHLQAERMKVADLERKAGVRKAGSAPSTASGKSESVGVLQEKLMLAQQECKRLKLSCEEQIATREEELRICRDLLNQNKAIFDKALHELRNSIAEKFGEGSTLARENDELRAQVHELRSKQSKKRLIQRIMDSIGSIPKDLHDEVIHETEEARAKRWKNVNWDDRETRLLLDVRRELEDVFNTNKKKKAWAKLVELCKHKDPHWRRDAEQCRVKFKNLKVKYKRSHRKSLSGEATRPIEFSFLSEMNALVGSPPIDMDVIAGTDISVESSDERDNIRSAVSAVIPVDPLRLLTDAGTPTRKRLASAALVMEEPRKRNPDTLKLRRVEVGLRSKKQRDALHKQVDMGYLLALIKDLRSLGDNVSTDAGTVYDRLLQSLGPLDAVIFSSLENDDVSVLGIRRKKATLQFEGLSPEPSIVFSTAVETMKNHFNLRHDGGRRPLIDQYLLEATSADANKGLVVFEEHPIDTIALGQGICVYGEVDYIVGRTSGPFSGSDLLEGFGTLMMPTCAIVACKKEDTFGNGVGQVLGEMRALQVMIKSLHMNGVLTDGLRWRFFRLEGDDYYHSDTLDHKQDWRRILHVLQYWVRGDMYPAFSLLEDPVV